MRSPIPPDALPCTNRTIHIIERQNARRGIIAPLIDLMNGHAATGAASMIQQRIHKRLDARQSDLTIIALQEGADASGADVAAQGKRACHAFADEPAHRHGGAAGDADDVVAIAVGRGVGERGGVGPVAEELHHALRAVVLDCGERAEAGAAAVDAQGGGEGGEEEEGGEGCGGGEEGGEHCEGWGWIGWVGEGIGLGEREGRWFVLGSRVRNVGNV